MLAELRLTLDTPEDMDTCLDLSKHLRTPNARIGNIRVESAALSIKTDTKPHTGIISLSVKNP